MTVDTGDSGLNNCFIRKADNWDNNKNYILWTVKHTCGLDCAKPLYIFGCMPENIVEKKGYIA